MPMGDMGKGKGEKGDMGKGESEKGDMLLRAKSGSTARGKAKGKNSDCNPHKLLRVKAEGMKAKAEHSKDGDLGTGSKVTGHH